MKTLIIVESPSKAKSIQSYAGKDYKVVACKGHITDLAKGGRHGLGVDVDNGFKPHYVITDDQVGTVDMLMKEVAKADEILLASDPDREGEAIAWHLCNRLEDFKKPMKRIEIHEITKKGVADALKKPRDINQLLFKSQEARRILDRLVGFTASPFLMNFFGSNLSAGRVQSVVTRMVVDREREIDAFIPEEYWVIQTTFANKKNETFIAKYDPRVKDKTAANKVKLDLENDEFVVTNVDANEEKKKPFPPLITSKLQQIMSKGFGINSSRTMKAAQSLYESGYVTYIRTDSIRVNADAVKDAREFLKNNGYDVPKTSNIFKNKNAAQDAHECIRPTDLTIGPDAVEIADPDEKKVYEVIWRNFLASQMNPAIYNTLKVSIQTKNNIHHILKASGKSLKYEGYLKILGIIDDSKIDIPDLNIGDVLKLTGKNPITLEQKFTQPPARFSESNLIKTLEAKNIGRPATYAELLSKITTRNYVETHGSVYHPTDLGKKITDELVKFFSFMEYDYTADMEEKLDAIETGQVDQLKMLNEFFLPFKTELQKAYIDNGSNLCEKCGSPMAIRVVKNGDKFLGCSTYPKCKNTKSIVYVKSVA